MHVSIIYRKSESYALMKINTFWIIGASTLPELVFVFVYFHASDSLYWLELEWLSSCNCVLYNYGLLFFFFFFWPRANFPAVCFEYLRLSRPRCKFNGHIKNVPGIYQRLTMVCVREFSNLICLGDSVIEQETALIHSANVWQAHQLKRNVLSCWTVCFNIHCRILWAEIGIQ